MRVPVQKAKPSLYLEKTSDKDKAVDLGETIHYTIRVVNNGNTAVSDVVVTDEMTGDSWNAGTLKPGEDKTFHTEYVVTEKDIGGRQGSEWRQAGCHSGRKGEQDSS